MQICILPCEDTRRCGNCCDAEPRLRLRADGAVKRIGAALYNVEERYLDKPDWSYTRWPVNPPGGGKHVRDRTQARRCSPPMSKVTAASWASTKSARCGRMGLI
jgi:hypothetical protein